MVFIGLFSISFLSLLFLFALLFYRLVLFNVTQFFFSIFCQVAKYNTYPQMIYTQIQGEFQEDDQLQTNSKYPKIIFLFSIIFISIIILLYLQLIVPSTSLHPTLLEASLPVVQPVQTAQTQEQKKIRMNSETRNYQQTSQILQNWNNKKFNMKNKSKDQIQNQYWHKIEELFDVEFEENEANQIQVEIDNQIRSTEMVQSGITDAQLEIAVNKLHKPIKIPQTSLTPPPTSPPGPHFCILVPTYNNHPQSRNLQNLASLLSQSYPNYHITLIDDASTDTTSQQLSKYIKQKGIKQSKVKLIKNSNRKMALQNIYEVGKKQCQFHHIIAVVDGDDWMLGDHVLERVARVFQAGDVWVVYGNFVTSGGGLGYSRPYHPLVIQHNKYRIAPFYFSHPRFFYCKLLHLIDPLDLQDNNGKYFSTATDVALYLPILEMSNKRVKYMNQIMYVYRRGTGLNNYQIRLQEQRRNEEIIRKRKKYRKLKILFKEGLL